ncbi:MAG: oligosaccharide flippase family protein [Acidimicrobiales bacterium]
MSSAARWSFVNSAFTRVAQLGVGVLLARLIAPEQFGAYAAALVVLNILLSFSELGVSVALVRHKGDPADIAPTVATLSMASSGALALLTALAAPWAAAAMSAPETTGVLRLMAATLVLAGPSAVPAALLQRDFRQRRKTTIDLTSFLVGAGVGVALAAAGFGAWSLAWSRVAGNAVSTIGLLACTPLVRPGWRRDVAGELLRFGLPLAGSSLLAFAVMNVDYIVVGNVLGPTQLGFYLLAFNLSSWPVSAFSQPIRSVSLAAFSTVNDDSQRLRASFSRALAIVMALTVPACVLLAALGGPLVRLVYGRRWAEATSALAVLALLGAVRVALELAYDLLASAGRSRAILKIHLLWLAALGPALVVGARLDGIRGVAFGHVAVLAVAVVPAYFVALHPHGITARSTVAGLARPALGALAMAALALGAQRAVGNDPGRLLLGGAAALAAYTLAVLPLRRRLAGQPLP